MNSLCHCAQSSGTYVNATLLSSARGFLYFTWAIMINLDLKPKKINLKWNKNWCLFLFAPISYAVKTNHKFAITYIGTSLSISSSLLYSFTTALCSSTSWWENLHSALQHFSGKWQGLDSCCLSMTVGLHFLWCRVHCVLVTEKAHVTLKTTSLLGISAHSFYSCELVFFVVLMWWLRSLFVTNISSHCCIEYWICVLFVVH